MNLEGITFLWLFSPLRVLRRVMQWVSFKIHYVLCSNLNLGWKNGSDSFKVYKEGAQFVQNLLRIHRSNMMLIWLPHKGVSL